MQTQIHFCDLCNESVPQSDLDLGRAFLRKGRVVCAKCDALMTPERHDAAPAATLTAEPALPPTPPPAVPSTAAPVSAVRAARERDRTALAIALVALLLTLLLGYWVSGQIDRVRSDQEERTASVAGSAADAKRAAERVADEARREIGLAEERLRQTLDAQRVRIEAAGEEQRRLATDVAARIDGLAREVAAMRETFGQVSRHDSELVALQQRYNALERELDELRAEVDRRIAEAAAAPPPAVEPPAPVKPAWIGLVDGLASANPSERWNAIHALGETRDPAAAEYVVPALEDVDIFIRMTAARVLGELASPTAIEPLIGSLEDGEGAVREAAYEALKKVSGRNFPFDPQSADASERAKQVRAWQEWWKKERERLGS